MPAENEWFTWSYRLLLVGAVSYGVYVRSALAALQRGDAFVKHLQPIQLELRTLSSQTTKQTRAQRQLTHYFLWWTREQTGAEPPPFVDQSNLET